MKNILSSIMKINKVWALRQKGHDVKYQVILVSHASSHAIWPRSFSNKFCALFSIFKISYVGKSSVELKKARPEKLRKIPKSKAQTLRKYLHKKL